VGRGSRSQKKGQNNEKLSYISILLSSGSSLNYVSAARQWMQYFNTEMTEGAPLPSEKRG